MSDNKRPLTVDQIKARSMKETPKVPFQEEEHALPSRPLDPQRARQLEEFAAASRAASQMKEHSLDELARVDGPPSQTGASPAPKAEASPRDRMREDRRRAEEAMYNNTAFDNPDVRACIEARCEELSFLSLVSTGRVTQLVPILKDGHLDVKFRSLTGRDSYLIGSSAQSANQYGQVPQPEEGVSLTRWSEWPSYARLALSIVSINGQPFRDESPQKVDTVADIEQQVQRLLRLPEFTLNLLFLNVHWFEHRVSKLYEADFDVLGNG